MALLGASVAGAGYANWIAGRKEQQAAAASDAAVVPAARSRAAHGAPRPPRRESGAITSSPIVDEELRRLMDLCFSEFIDNWYPKLTEHPELRATLRALVEDMVAAIERRIDRVDLVGTLYKDVVYAIVRHVEDFQRCREIVGTAHADGRDLEALFLAAQPHPALQSHEDEVEYLRQLAAWMIHLLLPESERNSEVVRMFLREALTHAVIARTLDKVAEPDFINLNIRDLLTPNAVLEAEYGPTRWP